jgi:short subunit dehydrogenase-like uncharacterized protein
MTIKTNEKMTDITVYGATSFVAKHVLTYLVAVSDQDLSSDQVMRITLGGRNESKLEAVKKSFAADCIQDVFVADGSSLDELQNMAKRSQVVLNCAGPYSKYSNLVVAACANVGCDYVDITAEVAWVARMREKHGNAAKLSGSRIVSFCGYDSIPSDMAVFCAVQALRKGISNSALIENARIWHKAFGMPNGGTIATFCDIPFELRNDFFQSTNDSGDIKLRSMPYFLGDPLSLASPANVKNNPKFRSNKNIMARSEWINQLLFIEPDFFYGVSLPFVMSAVNL